jgi:predicted nucleic acid-binding protein
LIPEAAEEDVPAAKAILRDSMEGRVRISVPALLYYEVSNVFLFGRSRPQKDAAALALNELFSIPLLVVPLTPESADLAVSLASTYDLSFYDASYVALAAELDCTLITADQRLLRKARRENRVRLLSGHG